MPLPSVTLRAVVNGGAPDTGRVEVTGGDSVALSLASTSGLGRIRFEIYGYPTGFAQPAGWQATAAGVYFYESDSQPPAFTVDADPDVWGKYMLRATAEGLIDEATALVCPSAIGLEGIGRGETTQFNGADAWAKGVDDDLHKIAAAGGGATPQYAFTDCPGGATTTVTLATTYTREADCLTLGGLVVVMLPASPIAGYSVVVVDTEGACSPENPITVNTNGGGTINGETTLTIDAPWASVTLVHNGTIYSVH